MPTLPTRSFQTIVANAVAGIQGRASALIDFGDGSPLRAIVEGFAGVFLWFQGIALQILTASRLSTSQGNDVDTFTADFMPPVAGTNSPRLGAQAASGLLQFGRYTAAASAPFIPVGATAQTQDGTQTFVVTADPAIVTFSAALNGYTMAAGLASITVPASAQATGPGGNAQAGSISVITYPLTGIDTVTNLAAFTGGETQETDAQLKARFAAYILGLSRGDVYGLTAAIEGAEVGAQWTFVENYSYAGAWQPGFFFVVADDGSGAPSPAFIQAITNAVWSVRPLGIQCAIFPPKIKFVSVQMTISTAQGYDHNTVVGLVANAVANGINGLGLGVDLDFNRLSSWAYSVQGVTKVTAVLLNGLSGDAADVSASLATQDSMSFMPIYAIKTNTVAIA